MAAGSTTVTPLDAMRRRISSRASGMAAASAAAESKGRKAGASVWSLHRERTPAASAGQSVRGVPARSRASSTWLSAAYTLRPSSGPYTGTTGPGTILRGHTAVDRDSEIGPNSMLWDCRIGQRTTVNASQLNDSTVGSDTTVGPFTYVRPGCTIGDHCRVGDFVEVKNSVIGDGTKISHLTYVGDSDVGQRVNFGCGTVTTNYDGHKKFRCTIGDDVFLGCNTNLIAPVTVGDRAYTAAGSTVTDDVPDGALAIARTRQTNKPGWADRLRALWKKNQ